MNMANDDKLEQQAKELFDDSVDRLDAATLSRLNRSRQAALAEAATSRAGHLWLRWAPATGMAAAAVIAVVMLRGPAPEDLAPAPVVTDFEILVSEDSFEMFEELDFYAVLDSLEVGAADNAG
jgi:hypothetical protein